MDDPTRWCENDASNGTRLPWAPDPKRGPLFFGGPVPPLNFRRRVSQFIRRYEHPRTVSSIPRFVDLDFRYTRDSSPNMERCVGVTLRPPLRYFA
jgi:hypothetical protein